MFTQEVDAFLQDGGLVHLPGVAWQHGAELLDEDIELVSPFLLRLITRHTATQTNRQIRHVTLKTFKSNNKQRFMLIMYGKDSTAHPLPS